MRRLLIFPLLASLALPTAVNASLTITEFDSNKWCSSSTKKAPKRSRCFKYTESNDNDPSVYILGKKYKDLESEKSKKPIPWGWENATDWDSLTLYTLEIRLHWIVNEARYSNGLRKLGWDKRKFKLTNKSRFELSNW